MLSPQRPGALNLDTPGPQNHYNKPHALSVPAVLLLLHTNARSVPLSVPSSLQVTTSSMSSITVVHSLTATKYVIKN